MSLILIAGKAVYEAAQNERRAAVGEFPNSEKLCRMQEKQAGRGLLGAQIVHSMYGYSVRYDSGLQDWALIRPTRGLPPEKATLGAAIDFCRDWVSKSPANRYAYITEYDMNLGDPT